jgi:Na+/proline symporter
MLGLPLADIIVLVLYFVIIALIGLITSRRVATQKDYYVGGRRFGKLLVMMQTFGVGTSNTHPILVAGAVYTFGMAGIWYSWLYMLFMPAVWVLQPLTRRLRIYTTPDYFELRYSSGLGTFFSISAIINLCIMTGTMLIGMGQIVEGITGGGLSKEIVIPITAFVVILYSTVGGMLAAAVTDVLQGILIVILSFMLLPPMFSAVGGLNGLHAALPVEKFLLAMPKTGDPTKTIGFFAIFMLFVNGISGNLVEPTAQTMQAAKNEWTLRIGGTIGAFSKRICTIGWALVGLCAIIIWPNLSNPELCFGMASRQFLPAGFSGLMIAGMLAAGMSTISALQVIAAAIFSRNLYTKHINKTATDKHYLFVARMMGATLMVLGIAVAFLFSSVRDAVEFWWKVTAFLGPALILGLFVRRGNSWGAWACIVVSAVVWQLTVRYLVPIDVKWSTVWYQSALYLPAGILAYFIGSFLTPPEDERKLARFYARLNTPVGQEHILINAGLEPHPEEILPYDPEEKSNGKR